MASWDEISRGYAQKLLEAIRKDGFTKTASLTESTVKYSSTTAALKEIAKSMERDWQVNGRPLTEDEKRWIAQGTGEHLGLSDPDLIYRSVKSSSNDAYMQLVHDIGQILKDKKKT